MTDSEKLKKTLKEINVPFEVHSDEEYEGITINASASDKYVSLTFKDGKYIYGN
jgi:hypothetical protein